MKLKITFFTLILLSYLTNVIAQDKYSFYVEGRYLYDKCGEQVILRGVSNPNIWFEKNGIPRYAEIQQTGANVVRIVWSTDGTAIELDAAITNCLAQDMIPMVELHDATGDWSKLQLCVDYWTDSEVLSVIFEHEEVLLINIANEAGDGSVSAGTFYNGYKNAVTELRNAGIINTLVIDAPNWGQNINIIQSEGPKLITDDPEHNLLFSIHMWWPSMYGYSESDIVDEIAQSVEMELPLIVGEFSQMHGDCDENTITASNSIAYKTIIRECQENEVGYIAWSWFGNCNEFWDMSTDGTFNTLYDWGLEVAVTDDNSIQNTAVRPYYLVNGSCNTNTSSPEELTFKNNTLLQNYPNPFSEITSIKYHLSKNSQIRIVVYNSIGEEIKILIAGQQSQGDHSLEFNSNGLSGGLYYYSLETNDIIITRKMLIIK